MAIVVSGFCIDCCENAACFNSVITLLYLSDVTSYHAVSFMISLALKFILISLSHNRRSERISKLECASAYALVYNLHLECARVNLQ